MLATMYNHGTNNSNVTDDALAESFQLVGARAPLHADASTDATQAPRNISYNVGQSTQFQGGGICAQQWSHPSCATQQLPPQMIGTVQMQQPYLNIPGVSSTQQQPQGFFNEFQTQLVQPQPHALVPATHPTQSFQSIQQPTAMNTGLVSPPFYNDGLIFQRSTPMNANNTLQAPNNWNTPMSAMTPHSQISTSTSSSYYPSLHQDTPQTQQAIALQKAALQQQMQQAYGETQQFGQLAMKQQMRAQAFAAQQQQLPGSFMHLGLPQQRPSELVTMGQVCGPTRVSKKRRAQTFPEKFMTALLQRTLDDEIVAWLPDGKSFVIVNPELFVQQVLSPVFKHSKYASFVRKLHRWGFQRLTSGTGTDCFHHPLFQKDRMDLASQISCVPREGMSSRHSHGGDFSESMSQGVPELVSLNHPPSLAGVERFVRSRSTGQQNGPSSAPLSRFHSASQSTGSGSTASVSPVPPMNMAVVGHAGLDLVETDDSRRQDFDRNEDMDADDGRRAMTPGSPPTSCFKTELDQGDDGSLCSDTDDPSHTGMLKRTLVHALQPKESASV